MEPSTQKLRSILEGMGVMSASDEYIDHLREKLALEELQRKENETKEVEEKAEVVRTKYGLVKRDSSGVIWDANLKRGQGFVKTDRQRKHAELKQAWARHEDFRTRLHRNEGGRDKRQQAALRTDQFIYRSDPVGSYQHNVDGEKKYLHTKESRRRKLHWEVRKIIAGDDYEPLTPMKKNKDGAYLFINDSGQPCTFLTSSPAKK
eukprot:TRINITY_DN21931_c0_g1_i1.p1 TRINITY_DN21931_c0_g1~~TRINITY_DN21931_c0_g1_i1.p1  ORF type:complete len:205 (+),score=35.79 TRINITY_DN21931_c0_g1_i1:40-654(+)